ncbi:MAG: M1 family peptidase [Myxococcales bacterium]|nr:M1 family peptidase [Myxococcales bacterium]
MARLDPHSWNDTTQPETERLTWRAKVDFATRTLEAEAELTFRLPGAGSLDLDTRDLAIASVSTSDGKPLEFMVAAPDPILGARLRVILPEATAGIRIRYRTAPGASALQWLTPAQTAGGEHPYLFSQCQAIHARSVVPLQDTPRIRIRYRAELTVPVRLRALMAAAFVGREERGAVAVERWEMPQPIPPYLFAFAVGDLVSRDLGARSRVWAEPAVVERAAWEFATVDAMLHTAEELFGPYPWERFDLLTMPPSFPYGGMENPRLTFLTPTLLAGDRSLVNVVAHELAHSWTGNLVSNASAEHFWLNEGFTVFAERRIVEALGGVGGGGDSDGEEVALQAAIGRRDLDRDLEQFRDRPDLTRLRTHLEGIDPDEAFSRVPYEKGYLFLRTLEESVGRAAFSAFLRRYIDAFRFQTLTSEEFAAWLAKELPEAVAQVDVAAWIDGPGIPAGAPAPRSARLDAIARLDGRLPDDATARAWTPTEWQLFLESLARPSPQETCRALDQRFQLTASGNHEVLVAWLVVAAESGYAPALPRIEEVLASVGRMKYLKPLYTALAKAPSTRDLARRCFARCRDGYHPIAQQVIEAVLQQHHA